MRTRIGIAVGIMLVVAVFVFAESRFVKTVRVSVTPYADTVLTLTEVGGFVTVYNEGKRVRIAYGDDTTSDSYRVSDPEKELCDTNTIRSPKFTVRLKGDTEDDTVTATVVYGK